MNDVNGAAPGDRALRYEGELAALVDAWHARDEAGFFAGIDALATGKEGKLLHDIGELTREIRCALERFCADARLEDLTHKEVPDARVSLEHVLEMTAEAAHRTMDLVERSCGPAEHTRRLAEELTTPWRELRERTPAGDSPLMTSMDEFLAAARLNAEQIRGNLTEVLLAQGYQDLSGQIIRSVMRLIDEIQDALAGLMAISRGQPIEYGGRKAATGSAGGPCVPGVSRGDVVAGQDDVDLLLSGLDL